MKTKTFFIIAILLALAGLEHAKANDIDTVWMRWMPVNHSVSSVRFSPNNSKIAVFSIDQNAVAFVNTIDGTIDTLLNGFSFGEYSQDGQFIFSFKSRLIYKINTEDYSQSVPFDTAMRGISSISISDNGFITCKIGSGFQVWNMETGSIIFAKEYEGIDPDTKIGKSFINIKFTKDGKYLIASVRDVYENYKGEVYISKVYTELIDPLNFEVSRVIDYTEYNYSSNNGRYIAGEYFKLNNPEDIAINVYDIEINEIILSIPGYGSTISDIAFSPDDRYMAVAFWHTSQGRVEIWDLINKYIVYEYYTIPPGYPIVACDISQDGDYITFNSGEALFLFPFIDPIGIPENTIQATITYPNPAENIFNLEFDLTQDNMTTIDIVDLTGFIVKEIDHNFLITGHQVYSVDITNLSSGFYTLRILSGAFSFNGTIIKN
ncbi:T9SS type A sorting domain-containing protein [Bacteroidota bacterium]